METDKKKWETPELVEYGSVEEITGGGIPTFIKGLGTGDDIIAHIIQELQSRF